jgi:hypothetical protein
VITLIAVALAGVFIGIAAHQRVMLREARFENSAYQDGEVQQAEVIGNLRAQVKAHETSLTMIMEAMGK